MRRYLPDPEYDRVFLWFVACLAVLFLASFCFGQEAAINGPSTLAPTEGQFYTLTGIGEEDIQDAWWVCIPLSKQAELSLCLVYDPITKDRHPALYFKPRELGEHTLILDINTPGRYGFALKEVAVGETPEPGPGPDPEPDPEPDPKPEPLDGWAKWTKLTAERVIPGQGRREQARTLAGAMAQTIASEFGTAKEFRVAMKAENRKALGEDAWALWNSKFDSLLTQELVLLIQQGRFDVNNQTSLRNLYAEVVRGLEAVE